MRRSRIKMKLGDDVPSFNKVPRRIGGPRTNVT